MLAKLFRQTGQGDDIDIDATMGGDVRTEP